MQQESKQPSSVWCVIPVYNNRETLRAVAERCRALMDKVLVVDDGSTDADAGALLAGLDVLLLKHEKNLGKGRALLTAARHIWSCGGQYMITIDADGQHDPDDIAAFLPFLNDDEPSVVIGSRDFDTDNVPAKSRFGRKFANFWLRLETGVSVDDCQSGFRAYPLKYLMQMSFKGNHYDFEAEVLAKAAWAGLALKGVPIRVYYPKPEERVSHFRPFMDNLRISLVHSMLVGRRLLPFGHKRLVPKKTPDFSLFRHPGLLIKMLLKENATPGGLAAAAAAGVFLGVLPILFAHTLVILYVATRLKLNKIVAVNAQHICMPPFVPALCIEIGFFLRRGHWLSDISFATVFQQFSDRIFEWFLGSLIVAPVAALLMGTFVYVVASAFSWQRGMDEAG